MSISPLPQPADPASELLDASADALHRAQWVESAALRYELAYLCALRSGAAVLALRARPCGGQGRPRALWDLLAATAPGLAEWAGYFAACGTLCAAAAEGRTAISARQADDLVRDAAAFLAIARGCVGRVRTGRTSAVGSGAPREDA